MRLATFVIPAHPHHSRIGVEVDGRLLDIAKAEGIASNARSPAFQSLKDLLGHGKAAREAVRALAEAARTDQDRFADALFETSSIRFLPPIPDADKFLCVGKNYRSHLEELKRTDLIKEMPNEPTGFIKLNACLAGHDTDIVRPRTVTHLDYEPELVFVIGETAFEVGQDNAFDHVAGITLLNDLTCRDTQKREVASGSRFWTAKNAPGFGPLGSVPDHDGRSG